MASSGSHPSACKREAIALYRHCAAAKVRKVPGLLRDLGAEVGAEEPQILTEALRASDWMWPRPDRCP